MTEDELIETVAKTIASASGLGWEDAWGADDGEFFKEVAVSVIGKVRSKDRRDALDKLYDAIESTTGFRP